MIYLLISIFLNIALFLAFRSFRLWRIRVFQAVVVNYIVCSLMGALFLQGASADLIWPLSAPWQYLAALLGCIFIGTFYILGLTTGHFGITIATISSKMSLIIPVICGLYVFKTAVRPFDFWNYLGVAMALSAVVLTAIKRGDQKMSVPKLWYKKLLPLALFIMAGVLDSLINYANYRYLDPQTEIVFIWMIFITAATIGIVTLLLKRQPLQLRSIWGGLYLGIPNFFSMFFIIKALSAFDNDGAVLFPLFNVGIILGSTLSAVIIFKERLLTINKLGIILAVLSVIMISYKEIIIWFH